MTQMRKEKHKRKLVTDVMKSQRNVYKKLHNDWKKEQQKTRGCRFCCTLQEAKFCSTISFQGGVEQLVYVVFWEV